VGEAGGGFGVNLVVDGQLYACTNACASTPTLSPTDPVPRGLLTLCPAPTGPVGQSWPRAQLWPTGSVYVCMYI